MMENISIRSGTTPVAPVVPRAEELEERRRLARIKRIIRRHTSGGVQQLAVEMQGGIVRLRGRCVSFYCKQLAQQAAMGCLPGEAIINQIEVALPR